MPDREKVIKGLEIHTKPNSRCVGCPYPNNGLCGDQLYHDALTLLKEQEPIEPITSDGDDLYWQPGDEDYACGACGEELAGSWWVYCPHCGRKVKWE